MHTKIIAVVILSFLSNVDTKDVRKINCMKFV